PPTWQPSQGTRSARQASTTAVAHHIAVMVGHADRSKATGDLFLNRHCSRRAACTGRKEIRALCRHRLRATESAECLGRRSRFCACSCRTNRPESYVWLRAWLLDRLFPKAAQLSQGSSSFVVGLSNRTHAQWMGARETVKIALDLGRHRPSPPSRAELQLFPLEGRANVQVSDRNSRLDRRDRRRLRQSCPARPGGPARTGDHH